VDIRGLLILCGGLLVMGCKKSALPLPRLGPNEHTAPIVVPYPPPPARPEIITPMPGERVVWIDGSWTWDRRRWIWQRGRWEAPPTGAHYALSKIVHFPDGTLGWIPGGWQTRTSKSAEPARTD
jgi:hypothetical protein